MCQNEGDKISIVQIIHLVQETMIRVGKECGRSWRVKVANQRIIVREKVMVGP